MKKDAWTWVDYTMLAFTCGVLQIKRSGTGSEGCLRYVPTLFYFIFLFIYSLLQQPHNLPRLTSSSPLQPQMCPINLAVCKLLCLAAKHRAHALHAQIALQVPLCSSRTLTLPNYQTKSCSVVGKSFSAPRHP